MSDAGTVTASEEALRFDERRFTVVSRIAAVVAVPFAATHLVFAIKVVPTFGGMFASMGGDLPAATGLLVGLGGWVGAALFVVVDVAVFVAMYRLARRYWIGLLFVPPIVYVAISAVLVPLLYVPMFEIITLVK
jgi:hypothetical protein